jgi:hypothetical protein
MIKRFYQIYGYYYIRVWIIYLLSAVGLFLFSPLDIAFVLLVGLLFYHLYGIIYHDWISHSYIEPRNLFFKWILLLVFYSQDNTIQKKKNYHVYHHKTWTDPSLDPTQQKLKDKTLFRYLFSLHKPVSQNISIIDVSLLEKEPMIKSVDKYGKFVYSCILISLFVIFPFKWFFAVAIYFPCIILLLSNYHDYYFHGPLKGKDKNYLTVLFSTQAWHIEHHERWREEYYGPGYWYLINPGWYFRKLFFVKI